MNAVEQAYIKGASEVFSQAGLDDAAITALVKSADDDVNPAWEKLKGIGIGAAGTGAGSVMGGLAGLVAGLKDPNATVFRTWTNGHTDRAAIEAASRKMTKMVSHGSKLGGKIGLGAILAGLIGKSLYNKYSD